MYAEWYFGCVGDKGKNKTIDHDVTVVKFMWQIYQEAKSDFPGRPKSSCISAMWEKM